jgi:DNA-binding transcriptional regulator of glucitol operon
LHLAVLVWVPVCLVAGWWQVNRAFDGNGLSYLYSVEWPVFALVGIWAWWVFIHTDPDEVGAAKQRKMAESDPPAASSPASGRRRPDEEDPELAAYNDRLAALAGRGRKTWRNP